MPCGWEGNRGLASHWPCMRHRLQWFIHLRAQGLRKGDERPAYTLNGVWHTTFTNSSDGVAWSVCLCVGDDREPCKTAELTKKNTAVHHKSCIRINNNNQLNENSHFGN